MLLLTTEVLPENCVIEEMFHMVYTRGTIEVSSKGLVRGYLERNRNEAQELIDNLASLAPAEANAIIGIKVSTAVQRFTNYVLLFTTYIGTPVRYRQIQEPEGRE